MSEARIEILKLIAAGKMTPEEGERLLAALDEPPIDAEPGRSSRFAEAVGQMVEEIGETVRHAVDEAMGSTRRTFEEHRPTTEGVDASSGSIPLPDGARLKIQQAIRVSFGGGSKGGNVVVRAKDGDTLRILRGEAIELHRDGDEYVLTWAKGSLEIEIPRGLVGLQVRCLGGDLEIRDYPGAMALETMGGELRLLSPRSPFRCRTLGGRVRIVDLDLREGSSSIQSTGGEVQIEAAAGASLTIQASTLGGAIEFPEGAQQEVQGWARRRVLCRLGDGGGAELNVKTLGGDVRLRQAAS